MIPQHDNPDSWLRKPDPALKSGTGKASILGQRGAYGKRYSQRIGYLFAAALFVMGIAFIAFYAKYGRDLIAQVAGRSGAELTRQAETFAAAGDTDAAIAAYKDALNIGFDQPQQQIWTMQKLSKLLLAEDRAEEAVVLMRAALALDAHDGWNYGLLAQAYQYSERNTDLADLAPRWFTYAQEIGHEPNMMLAKYYEGLALLGLSRSDEALTAFLDGYRIYPSTATALNAARLLERRGRFREAEPLLNFVVQGDAGAMAKDAAAIQARIERAKTKVD